MGVPFYNFFGEGSPTKIDYRKKLVPSFQPLYWRTQLRPRIVGQILKAGIQSLDAERFAEFVPMVVDAKHTEREGTAEKLNAVLRRKLPLAGKEARRRFQTWTWLFFLPVVGSLFLATFFWASPFVSEREIRFWATWLVIPTGDPLFLSERDPLRSP